MKNIRQRQKQIRQTAHKKAWARMKSLKAQFKIDQSLQGMHLVLAKYQRIYKRELVLNLLAKEEEQSQDGVPKQPQKTSDVTKIKGWKNKFGENGGDSSKSLKHKGKLHWKTEESLLKSLHPDELREYGFDLKKKRRKNLIFTIRKGMSKGDGPGSKTEKVAESLDGGLGGQRIGRPIKIPKSHEETLDDGEATKEPESESKQEVDDDVTKEEAEPGADGVVKKKRRKRRKNTFMIITLNTALANFALTALDKKFVPKKKKSPKKVVPSEEKKEGDEKIVDQSDEKKDDAGSHDLSQNLPEVKTEPRDEVGQDSDVPRPDSRNSISRPESRESHCDSSNIDDHTRPDSTGSHDNEDSKDKSCGKARYATLPKRETTYRLAKNLDAVSRKAMLVYETSEMYADHKGKTRKRQSQTDHSMDYDLSLFDSESDGEDNVDLYSCARHLPYNTNNRRPTRKCTCGVNHDLVCKSAESLVAMNKQNQPKGADGKAKTPGAGKAASNLPKPPDHFPMPGWHTQWVCLKSNKEPAKSENNGIKLLEIMSNCNWEPHKQKLLSKISIMLQNGGYPKPRKKLVGEYYIEFLPKSEKPAVIPMEVRKNIPDTIYAVRTRIYKKLDSQYMNELIKEQEKILESRVPAITEASKTGAQTINSSVTSYAAQSGFDSKISGKQSNEKSQQIPKVKVQGGISGLSQLQYSQQVSPASDAKIMQSNTCMSHTTTTSFVYSTPKTSINLNSSSSTAKSAGFVSLTSTTRVGAVVPQSSASIDNVTESTQVSTMVTSSMNPVSAQQANTSFKSTSSVTVSSNSAVSKVSLSITQPSKTNNVHAKEIISQLEKPPLSTVCTSALFNVSSEVSKSVVSSVISSIHQSISTSQPLVTKKTVHVPIDTSVRTVPRVAILSSKSSTHSSVQSLGKKAEYIGSFKGKLVTGTAVAQLVTPITVSGIDVTSNSLTSTTTTDSLPSKPKTNATPTSTEKPKASTPCILDANKYSPLKLNPDLLKPLDSMKASKPSILDASKFSPLKLSSLKTSDTQVSTSEKLCAIGSKTTPVTLLGPFDSPSKIPKVLPHMKVLQAKSISKDGKPVIHLIPYTTPMSGASVASNIMSVPITLSSITSVSDPKGVKIPAAHEVKPDVLPVMPRVDQPDLTTGCMFTVSNPVATTTSASTSVPMETSVGSSVTSPIESEHIMPSHGDQIILLSSGEANDKIMEKLQSASKLDTEAVLTASEDCRRKGGDYSIRNEACDNEEEDSQGTKENHKVEKEDNVEEKSALKRKPVEDDDGVKSKDVKKRKTTSDEDGASMLAKILASTDAEQAYVQSRGVGVAAQMDRKEGDGTKGLGASDMNDTTDGQNASKSVRESENESDEEVALHLDLSDDTDETVAGGLMESDLSNQSLEEKKGQGQGDREVSEEKVEGDGHTQDGNLQEGHSQEVHSQEVHPQEVHSQETEPPVEEEETEENKEEPKFLLALELTKGPSASNNTESGDSNSAESETANSEISKKRKPEDESEEGPSDAMPKTKRLKSGSEEKGEGSDITGVESGVTERDTEDWDSQMCMVEDTDDMTVVIPSDDETDAPQPRSNQDVDCVVLDSSDEEIDVEEDSGIDAVHLLRKQAAIMKECYKVTCNVHRVGKLDFKTKRKSTHDANVIMDEKPEFREGVVMASSSKSATYKKVKSEEKSKAQIKRREEMRDSFVYLAEAMYGTNQSREHIMKTLCGNEQKLGLMKKATFVIKSLAEFDKKFNQGFREMSVKNNMLKEKLNSLKNFMIRERGMPWMVLQAHLDKISKVCTKIIQNMPAILKTRAAGAPIRMLRPGVTVMGIRGQTRPHPGGRPSLQVRQAGPRPAGLRLLSSTFPSFPHTKIGINQNTGIRQANASAGSASSQVKPSKDVKESAKEKDYAGERKKTQKVGSAKRKPSHTSPAVYIDYAEDEAEVYEDLMGGKSDFGDHFGDHVLDLTSDGEDSTLAVSKAGDGKMPNKTDDRSKTKSDKTPFKTDSQVATYHIETSNSTVGSALINASDSLSTNVLNQSSVVEVSMSDFGKVAKLQNGHPADSLSTPISHSVSDSDKFLVNSNNSNSTSLDLGNVKSEPNL
ncbi:hypothetical protein FSP39_014777 [Pinctada imbricata]|uniref:Uncharacterized protein n=1 Tax=Pinctada imbricata TaxID=66713 RepID=A0AA89C8X6_PINIB|nr:hypothetical protein FSP39_014777 [Pinctada imbricata]